MNEDKLYYSIGEVAKEFNVTLATLRYWEKEFSVLKPDKNKRGVRFYKKQDLQIIRQIIYLTKQQGYTIDGAKKIFSQQRIQGDKQEVLQTLNQMKSFLLKLKEQLNKN